MARLDHKAHQAIRAVRKDHRGLKDRKASTVLKVRLDLQAPVT